MNFDDLVGVSVSQAGSLNKDEGEKAKAVSSLTILALFRGLVVFVMYFNDYVHDTTLCQLCMC